MRANALGTLLLAATAALPARAIAQQGGLALPPAAGHKVAEQETPGECDCPRCRAGDECSAACLPACGDAAAGAQQAAAGGPAPRPSGLPGGQSAWQKPLQSSPLSVTSPPSAKATGQSLVVTLEPDIVPLGGHATIRWSVQDARSCLITSNGWNLWTGTEGVGDTGLYGKAENDTVYTLTCEMADGSRKTGQATMLVPVQVPRSDLTFDAMHGANIFDGYFWFSNSPALAPIARKMNLNAVRVPINLWEAVRDKKADELVSRLRESMDAFAAQGLKAIPVLGGFVEYDKPCKMYGSYRDVEPLARRVVAALARHRAVYAWELMNEAHSTHGDGLGCDKASIGKSVREAYRLVRTLDPKKPTSVSEAWYWWYLPQWADVSSFAGFHIYPPLESPVTSDALAGAAAMVASNIDEARRVIAPMPLTMGEFGETKLSPMDGASFYQAMYKVLRAKDIGNFFWDLSVSDREYGVLAADGTLSPSAGMIQALLDPRPMSFYINPPRVAPGSRAYLTWSAPTARSCTVYGSGYTLWTGTQSIGDTQTYGNPTSDQSFTLVCSMPSGQQTVSATVGVDR